VSRERGQVQVKPWGPDDITLLEACVGDPAMMVHLGGPEAPEKIAERQARYERPDSKQYKIVDDRTGQAVGWVGYWERAWRQEQVYEIGWAVVPTFQGRGMAREGTQRVIEIARAERQRRWLHAFPSVANGSSNAICRRLGFELLETIDFEYPKGSRLRCHDWRLDLFTGTPVSDTADGGDTERPYGLENHR
jgi:RimJ/RimL family protein N-acetyltransferase